MPDFGQCGESSCQESAVRLFDCAHHCMKMVCLQHLIEHDRLFEHDNRQLHLVQTELKRLYTIYGSFVDEKKLRTEYEQKVQDYQSLAHEIKPLLENHCSDLEHCREMIEKLKRTINDKQKPSGESLMIVKVEPIDEMSTSAMINSQKDESLFIGFDRLQNLIIDTDYHRRKAMENAAIKNKSENKTDISVDDSDYNLFGTHHRIAGQCPLWTNGSYGLSKHHHSIRLCRKKRFTDLSNHIRQYHSLLAPVANVIARAVHSKIPTNKRLIPKDLQVNDPRRSFLCPFRADCKHKYWVSGQLLQTHLIEAHQMSTTMAEDKVKHIRRLNRSKPMPEMTKQLVEVLQKIDLASKQMVNEIKTKPSL